MIPDVYHGDPIVDMNAFLSNSEFVILKCTQGTGYTDPTYAERSEACRDAGKPFWAYSFMENKGGVAQASHLLDNAGSGYAGLILDCEDYKGTRPTRAQVQEAYDAITSRGIKCMVYYMDSEAGDYEGIAGGDLGADWVARYGRNDGSVSKYPSTTCDLHQYTSAGSMPGVSGNCDLSRVTGDGKALEWFMGGSQSVQQPGETVNDAGFTYRAHVSGYGWLDPVRDGQVAGTTGKGVQLEAIKITPPDGLTLNVKLHIQDVGWTEWRGIKHGESSGEGSSETDPIIGTVGRSLRAEAIEVETVENTTGKKLKYMVHLQDYGWTGWVEAGYSTGTVGIEHAIEAIRFVLE